MRIFSIIIALAFCFTATGFSQTQKIAYVNSQALLQNLPEVQEADANLEAFQKQLQKRGEMKFQQYQSQLQELQRKEKQGELSPKQVQEEATKLQAQEQELMDFQKDMEQQLMEKRQTLLQPILDKVNDAIADIAKREGYTYVLDASAGVILYADEVNDITPLVKSTL